MANLYFGLFAFLGIVTLVGGFAFSVWLNKQIPALTINKYEWITLMKGKFSPLKNWGEKIDLDDVVVFRRFRKFFLIWLIILAIILIVEFLIFQRMIFAMQSAV